MPPPPQVKDTELLAKLFGKTRTVCAKCAGDLTSAGGAIGSTTCQCPAGTTAAADGVTCREWRHMVTGMVG